MSDTSKIENLLAAKKWLQARALLQEKIVTDPGDHWLWMHLGLTYYEKKDYDRALSCSKRAVELQPDCALALWHYAGSLVMSGREQAAVAIWTILLDMDVESIADGECGEGMNWALQLVNDVHYRMGRYFEHRGKRDLAREAYEKYIHNRSHGVTSLYDAAPIEKKLAGSLSSKHAIEIAN